MYKVFVSMRFKNRTEEQVKEILNKVKNWFKEFRPAELQDDEEVEVVCNYWCKVPVGANRKLWQLGNALQLMAECKDFVLIKDRGKEIPKGCKIEIEAWKASEPGKQLFFNEERQYFRVVVD